MDLRFVTRPCKDVQLDVQLNLPNPGRPIMPPGYPPAMGGTLGLNPGCMAAGAGAGLGAGCECTSSSSSSAASFTTINSTCGAEVVLLQFLVFSKEQHE